MKKLMTIVVSTFLIYFISCSKADQNLPPTSQEIALTPESLEGSEPYIRTIRDNMRLDLVLSLPNSKNSTATVTDEILNGILTDLEKKQGKEFADDARKVIQHEDMSSFINSFGSNNSTTGARVSAENDIATVFKNAPKHIRKSTQELCKLIENNVKKYEDKISKNSVQPNKDEVETILKKTIGQYEEEVIKDKSLTNDEKKDILSITTFNYANAGNLAVSGISLAGKGAKNGRISGFFSTLWNIIVTVVVYVVGGAVAGGILLLDPVGVLIGGVVGFIGGIIAVANGNCLCFQYYGSGSFTPYTCPC